MKKIRSSTSRKIKKLEPYLFILPVLICLVAVFVYPIIKSFIMAFYDYSIKNYKNPTFSGLDNFTKIFSDPYLKMIALNSLKYVVVCVTAQCLLGLILALCLNGNFKGRGFLQSLVFLPWATSSLVVGLMFRWAFNGEYGVVNYILTQLGFVAEKIAWLGTSGLSLGIVMLATIWMGVPFFGIMLLAALKSIPDEIYEAAEIDGASCVKAFFRITLKYITPTLLTTVLLRTIWTFNQVELIVVMTNGGPAFSSETLSSYLYTKAFLTHDFGFSSALGLIFMVGLTIYVFLYIKTTRYGRDE